MMPVSFETMKRLALEQLSVLDFLRSPCPVVMEDDRSQRPGESSATASDRWRRQQAVLADDYWRHVARLVVARNAVRKSVDLADLRAVLRLYALGGSDDVSNSCRVLLKRIDRQ